MQTSPRPVPARPVVAAGMLLVILGCAGVAETETEVVPAPAEPPPEAVAAVDTATEDVPVDEAPVAEPAPSPEEAADGDDGVAAADPEEPEVRRPAPAPEPPAAGEAEEEDGGERSKARKPPAPAPPGISQVNGNTWQVTQRLVDRWQADPYSLGNVRESGEGWELLGIRQRNAYHLGMRNSDIVLEVNGRKLNTMPQLLAAYMALKNHKSFDVVFLRRGARKVHHYKIVN